MRPGEKPLEALRERGVEYVEVRILDINPFLPVGIDAQQIRFLDAFLLYCLLSDSDDISAAESEQIRSNQQQVVLQGRKPSLMLRQAGNPVAFGSAAKQLMDEVAAASRLLDQAHGSQHYHQALTAQLEKVDNSELTPSGQMMGAIAEGVSFAELMLRQAKTQQDYFAQQPLPDALHAEFKRLARASLQQQKALEASDPGSFDEFLQAYWASAVVGARSKAA